ncbi:hypothetical protein [Halomicrobium salinisoli]|uniref:hypothetical protein n=1 Tax=Halomicrobium salinisoli TaxID=2878391 RepID=UPI001CEFE310|nr:hypothetical protein [Halomicrobium salinisoli]
MTDDTPADETEQATRSDEASASYPTLTLRAAGPATYKRRIEDSNHVAGVAIHDDVAITISRVLSEPAEFRELVEIDQCGEPLVDRERIVDDLLANRSTDYSRSGPLEEWSVTVEGPAADWKQFALVLATDGDTVASIEDVDTETATDAVWILHELIDAGMTEAGATLAVLELVDEYDLRIDCEPFVDRLDDGSIGDE